MAGLRAAGSRSGVTLRMDGTSVAAPCVTRELINMLGEENVLAQWAQINSSGGTSPRASVSPPDIKTRLARRISPRPTSSPGGGPMQKPGGSSTRPPVILAMKLKRLPPR